MRKTIPLMVLGALVLSALACGGGTTTGGTTGSGDTGGGTTGSGDTGGGDTGGSGSDALFTDDFSDSSAGWDEDSSDSSTVEYRSGKYVIGITVESWLAWANPSPKDFENIHLEVTAGNTGDAQDAGFGLICNYTDDGDFYYLAMSVDGFYIIAKKEGDSTEALSDADNQWLASEDIAVNQTSYLIGADCADGTLTLYVDGTQIASVEDDTFTSGSVGLIAATFDGSDSAEVTFDNYEVTQLN